MAIFGFSTKIVFKRIQTSLVLVQYFLKYPLKSWRKKCKISTKTAGSTDSIKSQNTFYPLNDQGTYVYLCF